MPALKHITRSLGVIGLTILALPAGAQVGDPSLSDTDQNESSFFGEKKDPLGDDQIFDGEIEAESDLETEQEAESVSSIDTVGSISVISDIAGLLTTTYDARIAYNYSDADLSGISSRSGDEITGRFRWENAFNFRDNLRFRGRLAFICSTDSCDPDVQLDADLEGNTLAPGSIAIDELLVQWFRTDYANLVLGRMQTKFVTRGGVFNKSLDRNNSHSVRVNWTDGFHVTRTLAEDTGWVANFIAEYNQKDGASNVRRQPLDFTDSRSRFGYFAAIENNKSDGYWVQRGIDLTYLPKSLRVDGTESGPLEDYIALVGRLALRYPAENAGRRLRFAGEYGYAFETPEAAGISLPGDDADANAWNVSASMMDVFPQHSVGILYGETGGGWLISPQYFNNERQVEVRWLWTPQNNLSVEARVRKRRSLEQRLDASRKDEDLNVLLRVTWLYSSGAL